MFFQSHIFGPRRRSIGRNIRVIATLLATLPIAALAAPAVPQIETTISSFELEDGGKLTWYRATTGQAPATGLFVLINGSGCGPVDGFFGRMTQRIAAAIPQISFDVVELEKQGVSAATPPVRPGSGEGCSDEFHEHNDLSMRVHAQRALLRSLRAKTAYRRIVVMGMSDGGNIAAALAAQEAQVTHLVLIGSGGMEQVDELRLLRQRNAFPGFQEKDFAAAFQDIERFPTDTSKFFLGQTYRYWNDMAWVDPLDYLLDLKIPVMVGIGAADTSVPADSVYLLGQAFAKAGKTNLSMRVYGNADHGLRVGERNLQYDFLGDVGRWLQPQ